MKRSALVFDFDGTLVDSAGGLRSALNETLREIGKPPLGYEAVRAMIGDGAAVLLAKGLAASGVPESRHATLMPRFLEHYETVAAAETRLYPGVAAVLAALAAKGRRLGICTNKPQAATVALLQSFGIERHFAAVIGGDVLAVRKPDPRHLLAVVAALDAGAADAVMVGDNEHDVAVAKAAGIPVILARYGYARVAVDTLAADAVIDRFDDLPEALAALEG